MIELYTVGYKATDTGRSETIGIYAYPSGGVGVTASDPQVTDALGGVHSLVTGIPAGEAVTLAQRLADLFAVLTDGLITDFHELEVDAA